MSIARKMCRRVALPLVALSAAAPALADVPQWLATETVNGLAVAEPHLYWASGCEAESVPSRSRIRWMQPAPPGLHPILQAVYAPRTLFETSCGMERVASNIAVDDRYLYWITADRVLLRLRRDGTARAELISGVGPANAAGYTIVVANNWLVWTTSSGVYRKWAGRGLPGFFSVHPVARSGAEHTRDLIARADGYLMRGQYEILRLVPEAGEEDRYSRIPLFVADNISAFAVSGNDVFAAVNVSYGYKIYKIPLDGSQTQQLYEGAHRERIDQIAADGSAVYWRPAHADGTGPLVRLPHGAATAEAITTDLRMSPRSRLIVSGPYLYWSSDEALLRLPTNAPSLGAVR